MVRKNNLLEKDNATPPKIILLVSATEKVLITGEILQD